MRACLLYALPLLQLGDEFIPPRSYLRQVLKSLLVSLESWCAADPSAEVLDELYALYTTLLDPAEAEGPKEDKRRRQESPAICPSASTEEHTMFKERHNGRHDTTEPQPEVCRLALHDLSWVCESCAMTPEQTRGILSGTDCTEFCIKTFRVEFPLRPETSEPSLAAAAKSILPTADGKLSEEQGSEDGSSVAGQSSVALPAHRKALVDQAGGERLGAGTSQRLIAVRVTPNLLQGGTG